MKRPAQQSRASSIARILAGVAVHELARTVLLLVLMALTLWLILEVFCEPGPELPWPTRLARTFTQSARDSNGLPIAPRFLAAARVSLAIVLASAVGLGLLSLALGVLFATRPWASVARLPLTLASAVPAFLLPFLGFPHESSWFWPAVCLVVGDLNLTSLTAHSYEGVRQELERPHVRTARALGFAVWSDVWPRATLVTLEGLAARIPHLLGGTVAIERAYNLRGLGSLALESVLAARPDYNVLIWIAGLGMVTTRLVHLLHGMARAVLTPARGRPSALARQRRTPAAAVSSRPSAPASERARDGTAELPGPAARSHAAPPHAADRAAPGCTPRASNDPPGAAEPAGEPAALPCRVAAAPGPPRAWQRAARRLRGLWAKSRANRAKVVLAALVVSASALLLGLVSVTPRTDPTRLEIAAPHAPPGRAHPLGTDGAGQDLWWEIAQGARQMALPLAVAVAGTVVLGGVLGTVSGLSLGSAADALLDAYAESLESVPKLILLLAALTYIRFDHYTLKLYTLIAVTFAPLVYRAVRDEVGSLRTSLFLEASRTLGVPRSRIVIRHVLRNHVVPVLCVGGAAVVGYVLLYDAILAYCGVRQYGQVLTWGSLLGTGVDEYERSYGLAVNPMIVWAPCSVTVLAIACSAVVADAIKSLGRSLRFSR